MSNEGQAPPPGGFPPDGEQRAPYPSGEGAHGGPVSQGGYGQPAPYQQPAHQQPAQQQGQQGQAPAPSPDGQVGGQPGYGATAAQPGPGQYAAAQPGPYAPGGQPGQYGQQGQPGQPGQYGPGPNAPAPVAPRPNPFAGIPVSDFVRDAVAALLLLVSLSLPVAVGNGLEGIGDRFHFVVTLVTVLSLVSLALPYLARGNVFPPSWTVHTTRLVRVLANAPYAVVVLVYVVLDAVTSDDTSGVGTIFALGLAGAVLAAQPRQSEMGPEDLDSNVSRTWWTITAGIGGFIALTYLVSLVFFLIDIGDFADYFGTTLAVGSLLGWLFAVAFSLWAVYGTVVLRSPSWRLVLIGLGAILVCVFVFGAGEDSSLLKIQSLRRFGGAGMFPLSLQEGLGALFVPAAAAAAAAPATLRALTRRPRVTTWITSAVHGFDYIILVAAAVVVSSGLWFFVDGFERPTGVLVTTIILGLLIIGAAVYARTALAKTPAASRALALGAAGATFVLGLVILILVPSDGYVDDKIITVGHLVLAFGLPIFVAITLTAPKDVREYFTTNRPAAQGATNAAFQWTAPAAQAPGYQYPGQQGASYGSATPAQQPYGAPTQAAGWQTQGAPAEGYAHQAPAPAQHTDAAKATTAQPEASQPEAVQPEASQPETGQPETRQAETVRLETTEPVSSQHAATSQPDAAPAPAGAGTSGFTAAQALDPNTPGAVLAQIVQDAPELRAQVAANPSTYPALLGWLSQLGDPEVDAALRNRQG